MKQKLRLLTLVTALLAGTFSIAAAQQGTPVRLSLEECVTRARSQAPGAIVARKNFESTAWNYRAFRSSLKPQVVLNVNTPGFTRSISSIQQPDGSLDFREQNQAFTGANLTISQAILPTGGSVFVSSSLNRIDVFGANGYVSYGTTPMLIGINQPVLRYNGLHWMQRMEPLRYQVAERQLLENLEDLSTDAATKFFDFYIASIRLQNEEANLAVNDSIFKISEGRYKVGKIAENDLLQSELAWMNARVQVENMRLDYRKAMQELLITLGLPAESSLEAEAPPMPPMVNVDANAAVDYAMQNRSDMLAFELRRLEAESNLARAKLNSRFNAELNATYGLNQTGNSIEGAYTQPLDRQSVSIGFNIPILQWGKAKAETRSAQALRDAATTQIEMDRKRLQQSVEYQVLEFLQLKQQVELASRSDTIAQRRYEVARSRYLIGKIDITNLQIAQNEKDNARASFYETLRRYWVAYYRLRRSTLYDFTRQQAIEPDRDWLRGLK